MPEQFTITTVRTIDVESIKGALCSAFEGGSTWAYVAGYIYPEGTTADDFRRNGKFNGKDMDYWHPSQIVPTHEGGALKIIQDAYLAEGKVKDEWEPSDEQRRRFGRGISDGGGVHYLLLNKEKLLKGLILMQKLYPKFYADEFPENRDDYNGDANSADIFLQCCLMHDEIEKTGQVIFG